MLTPMDQTCDEFRPGGDLAYSKVTTSKSEETSRDVITVFHGPASGLTAHPRLT